VKEWNQTFHFTDLPKKKIQSQTLSEFYVKKEETDTHIASLKLKGVAKGSQAG
jgi:hypothetical protein